MSAKLGEQTFHDEMTAERQGLRPGIVPVSVLSMAERNLMMERSIAGLHHWYLQESQTKRIWHPGLFVDWSQFRKDHSEEMNAVIEGFFAVEQFVPDYISALMVRIRKSYGRALFHGQWGAEEGRHEELWRLAMLHSGRRSPKWIEDYGHELRRNTYKLPWRSPFHMSFYTVIQERATLMNYTNTLKIASGRRKLSQFESDVDPILAQAAKTIAVDEAAHYDFFMKIARCQMYYFPARSLEALYDVIKHFAMPIGASMMPRYATFQKVVYDAAIYNASVFKEDVIDVALEQFGISSKGGNGLLVLKRGIANGRKVPGWNGQLRETVLFDGINFPKIEEGVEATFGLIAGYEKKSHLAEVDPTVFRRNFA